jgi:hypothetical protein
MSSHCKAKLLAPLLACALLSVSGAALAQAASADSDTTSVDDGSLGNHQKNVRFDLGARTQFIKGAGFDPFSERDALTQVSLGASWAFWAQDALSLAAVAGFDYGGSSAMARSDKAELDLARLALAPEARYHVLRVLAVTAKLGPTLTREAVSLSGGLGSTLQKTSWKGGFDATAGVAVELWGYASGSKHRPRLWFAAEGGYGWSSAMKLKLEPESSGAVPQRLVAPALDDLSISGPLFRATVALSYW